MKVGMVGDASVGKTSLMVKYIENSFNEDYINTLGVNFMEKTVKVKGSEITFSVWDLGGAREFVNLLPLVCNEASAILFMFDLSRQPTLNSIRDWYRQARGFNQSAMAVLIGTKFDIFAKQDQEYQNEVLTMARKFAKSMHAPLVFCSAAYSINIKKIFKIVLAKAFDLKCNVPEITQPGEPIIEYQNS
uniref:Septum-promoting GTP-binding protein 1 n=1 Tax=Arcella intermedia TaxID=1963864 RepID=A0A6B2LJC3_9EUKA